MADEKSERYELGLIGAVPQPNSGRGKHKKADGILGPFNVDIKEASKSFNLTRAIWTKITNDAFTSGNLSPMLKVVLGDNPKLRLVIIDESMFLELWREYSEKYGY